MSVWVILKGGDFLSHKKKPYRLKRQGFSCCRDGEIRTRDPVSPRHVL